MSRPAAVALRVPTMAARRPSSRPRSPLANTTGGGSGSFSEQDGIVDRTVQKHLDTQPRASLPRLVSNDDRPARCQAACTSTSASTRCDQPRGAVLADCNGVGLAWRMVPQQRTEAMNRHVRERRKRSCICLRRQGAAVSCNLLANRDTQPDPKLQGEGHVLFADRCRQVAVEVGECSWQRAGCGGSRDRSVVLVRARCATSTWLRVAAERGCRDATPESRC